MAEWRFLAGWSSAELSSRLKAAAALTPTVPLDADLRPEKGWNRVLSSAVVAQEQPGPPEPHAAFEHARQLVCRLAFSDPRIVVGHWRPNSQLRGRTVLLELRFLGLRFLGPVRIGQVREESDEARTLFGFRFDTLEGHVERGSEWFLLIKDHRTGGISFRIEAGWQVGDFPAWWVRKGFQLVGRRYQRAWHRLAHEHLKVALRDWSAADRKARGHASAHQGLPKAPVQFFAQKAYHPTRNRVEQEAEHMRRDRWLTVAAFGLLSGARSAMPPALLAIEREHRSGLLRRARHEKALWLARGIEGLALLEAVADKLPFTPRRTHPVSVAARAASGAVVGAAISPRSRRTGALIAALAAVAGTFAAYGLRRFATERLRIPNALAGLLEDVLVAGAGSRLASALP
jgi:uncharacterized membrane protein/uncharacterized protein (UPF0548 family)